MDPGGETWLNPEVGLGGSPGWILVDLGGSCRNMGDPGGSLWILVGPGGETLLNPEVGLGGSPKWILVDLNCLFCWILVELIGGSWWIPLVGSLWIPAVDPGRAHWWF